MELFGVTLSELQQREARPPLAAEWRIIVLEREREDLYARIDERVERMIELGWVEEARRLRSAGFDIRSPGLRGLGYDRLFDHLDGGLGLREAVRSIQQEHRNYAKRQLTWFRPLSGVERVHLAPPDGPEATAERITRILGP